MVTLSTRFVSSNPRPILYRDPPTELVYGAMYLLRNVHGVTQLDADQHASITPWPELRILRIGIDFCAHFVVDGHLIKIIMCCLQMFAKFRGNIHLQPTNPSHGQ